MDETPRGNTPGFLYPAVFLAILILGINLGVVLLIEDQQLRSSLLDVFSPVIDLFACVALFIAAKYSAARSKRTAMAWGTIASAMLIYSMADITWAILEVGLKVQPFPSIADAFYLAFYPVFLMGVFLLPDKPATASEQITKVLDIGIILLAAILGFWNFLIGPIILSIAGQPLLEQAILLAYPVGDLVLFGALLRIVYNHSEEQNETSIYFLAGTLLAMIVTDSIYSYQSLLATYVSGGLVDIGWIVTFLLAGLAGVSQMTAIQSTKGIQKTPRTVFPVRLISIGPYLPFFWFVGAFVLLIQGGLTPLPMNFVSLSLGVGCVIGLVILRQIITLSVNNRLHGRLKNTLDSLQTQAIELGKTNLELKSEIAERERVERQLSYNALHDAMTGLANRTLFLDRLGQAIEHTKRRAEHAFAVLFIDLDQFKVVNDSLGHLLGDQLILLVAQRLKDSLRSSDTIARFGGDEFEILLDVTDAEKTVLTVTDKIQEVVRLPFRIEEHEVYITASIGVLMSLDGYDLAEDVLRDADLAMYQAKALGKGRSEVFDINMRTQAFLHLAVENELRRALDNHELQLYYQPILSLEANRLVGFEALLRWHHPMRGILLPEEFLSIAEESGLILPISNWVLNETCSQLKQWHEQFPNLKDLTVNVNISSKQLLQPNFTERIAAALETFKLKAEYLKLEINEAALINNYARANVVFAELKNLGVQLQVDNFGKGHSAPGYLHQFPITTIKVDKSFIEGMEKGGGTTDFIRAIVSMSRELGIEIIAEGIETGEQLEELKKLLFDFGQGYLFSKPLDVESAEKILASQEKS